MIKRCQNYLKTEFFDKKKVESLLISQNIEFKGMDYLYILARALQIHMKGEMNIEIGIDKCIEKIDLTKKVLISPYSYNLAIIEHTKNELSK